MLKRALPVRGKPPRVTTARANCSGVTSGLARSGLPPRRACARTRAQSVRLAPAARSRASCLLVFLTITDFMERFPFAPACWPQRNTARGPASHGVDEHQNGTAHFGKIDEPRLFIFRARDFDCGLEHRLEHQVRIDKIQPVLLQVRRALTLIPLRSASPIV